MRPIDADAFKDDLDYICGAGGCLEPVTTAVITFVQKMIVRQPTIEPRARSKWWHYEDILQCCNCYAEFYDDIVEYAGDDVPKFCPNCGADMRGEEE